MTTEQMKDLAENLGTTLEQLFEPNAIMDCLQWVEVKENFK